MLKARPVSISAAESKQYLDYYGGNNYNPCCSIVYEITKKGKYLILVGVVLCNPERELKVIMIKLLSGF